MQKYKLLENFTDCVLLSSTEGIYIVRDKFDNDVIYMSKDYDNALGYAKNYNFNEVVKARREIFDTWLEAHAEA